MKDHFRAEMDMQTLKEAEMIKKDRERFNEAKRVAKEQVEALSTLTNKEFADLKAREGR